MRKTDINQVFAKNLKAAIERKFDGEVNQSAVARLSGLSQKTVSNILSALKTGPGEIAHVHSASLSVVAQLAACLDVQVWELVHPDPEKARREHEMYQKIESDFAKLPTITNKKPAKA